MLTYVMLMVENYLWSLKREEGQGMVEYALIIALIAIVVVVAMGPLGAQIATTFTNIVGDLGGAAPAAT